MDVSQIVERIGQDNEPTDAELSHAHDELKDALDAATSGDEPNLEMGQHLREALDSVVNEQQARGERREEQKSEAEKLREGIFGEPEPAVEDEAEQSEQSEQVEQSEPVAAGVIDRLREYANRVAPAEEAHSSQPSVDVRAIGPASGFELNQDAGFSELGDLFSTHAKSVTGKGTGQPLFRMRKHYDDMRTLGSNTDQNNRKLASLLGPDNKALAASGGLCGPGEVDHSHPILGDTGRPVRDALVQMNAARGKVTYQPTATLSDVDSDAIGVWDVSTDEDPGDSEKACPHVECPDDTSCEIQAVHRCLTVGNFQATFAPEFWASRLELLMVAFDRYAEQLVLEQIDEQSNSVSTVSEGNTLLNFITAVNDQVSYDRSVNRVTGGQYTLVADAWLRDQIRNQVAKNLGVANNIDVLQAADSQISGWMNQIGVNPIWTYDGTLDGSDHRVMGEDNDSFSESSLYLFPSDAFIFLDGGTLDLGTEITDSELNKTNDRQAFAESFEKTCLRGPDAYKIDIAVESQCGCENGS